MGQVQQTATLTPCVLHVQVHVHACRVYMCTWTHHCKLAAWKSSLSNTNTNWTHTCRKLRFHSISLNNGSVYPWIWIYMCVRVCVCTDVYERVFTYISNTDSIQAVTRGTVGIDESFQNSQKDSPTWPQSSDISRATLNTVGKTSRDRWSTCKTNAHGHVDNNVSSFITVHAHQS